MQTATTERMMPAIFPPKDPRTPDDDPFFRIRRSEIRQLQTSIRKIGGSVSERETMLRILQAVVEREP